MALTRSQLLAGDTFQGPVLASEVQGVKQGVGLIINPDGSIDFADGLGLALSGSSIKLSTPIQFGPPASGTLPSEAMNGSIYWDNNLGYLFIRYFDGSSTQWVQVSPVPPAGASGSFLSQDGKVITVANGLITSIV